jgi:lysophospholipase L1-like esterase
MRILLLILVLNLIACGSTYYDQRVSEFRANPVYNGLSFMGDSNTEGCRFKCPECFKGNRSNRGIGGATAYDMSRLMRDVIVYEQPDKIHIMIGTNDLIGGTDIYEYSRMLMRSLRIALDRINGVEIYISTILPTKLAYTANIDLMNQIIRTISDLYPNVVFKDRYNEFLDLEGNMNEELFLEDGVHLNKEGCQIMFGEGNNEQS